MADKFTPWQNKLTLVRVLDRHGKMVDYEFKRIMIDYANALLELGSEKEAREEVGCNEYDMKNWLMSYPTFKDYLAQRAESRLFANSIDKDFITTILGKAALGERELNAAQVSAFKLLMQSAGMISTAGNGRKKEDSPSSIDLKLE